MSNRLEDYRPIVGSQVIDELLMLADRVRHLRLQHINSTSVGGGVAEILTRMVPLLRDLGIHTTWDVIKGNQAFFGVTKAFHNALHGGEETITEEMFEVFRATTAMNLADLDTYGDVIVVHDPQPAGLIARKPDVGGRWLWRCHIDVSTPDPGVWGFLQDYVAQYDAVYGAALGRPAQRQEPRPAGRPGAGGRGAVRAGSGPADPDADLPVRPVEGSARRHARVPHGAAAP